MLHYSEIPPPPGLSPWIECFWFMRGAASPGQPDRVLPDGCVEIVLNLADPFRQVQGPDLGLQPRQLLAGPMTRHMLIQASGRIDLVGIRLRPGGASAFLPIPLIELQDQTAALDELECQLPRDLWERLGNAPSPAARDALLAETLLRACRPQHTDQRVQRVCRWMSLPEGAAPVDSLARRSGISTRTLERLFVRQVGVGPKQLQRILRFQRTIRRAEGRDPSSLRDSAFDAGYYDQSHFLKDFRTFAGVSPSVFFAAEANRMSEAFTSGKSSAGSARIPAGSGFEARSGAEA